MNKKLTDYINQQKALELQLEVVRDRIKKINKKKIASTETRARRISTAQKIRIGKLGLRQCHSYLLYNAWHMHAWGCLNSKYPSSYFTSWTKDYKVFVDLIYKKNPKDYRARMVELVLNIQKIDRKSINTIVSEIEKIPKNIYVKTYKEEQNK